MSDEQISILKSLSREGHSFLWKPDNSTALIFSRIAVHPDEEGAECGFFENGTYGVLENMDPREVYTVQKLF